MPDRCNIHDLRDREVKRRTLIVSLSHLQGYRYFMRVRVSQEALNSAHGKFEEMTGYPNEISIRQ